MQGNRIIVSNKQNEPSKHTHYSTIHRQSVRWPKRNQMDVLIPLCLLLLLAHTASEKFASTQIQVICASIDRHTEWTIYNILSVFSWCWPAAPTNALVCMCANDSMQAIFTDTYLLDSSNENIYSIDNRLLVFYLCKSVTFQSKSKEKSLMKIIIWTM